MQLLLFLKCCSAHVCFGQQGFLEGDAGDDGALVIQMNPLQHQALSVRSEPVPFVSTAMPPGACVWIDVRTLCSLRAIASPIALSFRDSLAP